MIIKDYWEKIFTKLTGCIFPGICGKPRIADVGGVPYLIPLVQKEKVSFFL